MSTPINAISFEEFKAIVAQNWKDPEAIGRFRNVEGIEEGRSLFEWQHRDFGAVEYDTDSSPDCWCVDNGRGTWGRGATYEEADLKEKEEYDRGFLMQIQA